MKIRDFTFCEREKSEGSETISNAFYDFSYDGLVNTY